MSHYFRCFINPVCNPCNRKSMSGQNSIILLIVIITIEFGHFSRLYIMEPCPNIFEPVCCIQYNINTFHLIVFVTHYVFDFPSQLKWLPPKRGIFTVRLTFFSAARYAQLNGVTL